MSLFIIVYFSVHFCRAKQISKVLYILCPIFCKSGLYYGQICPPVLLWRHMCYLQMRQTDVTLLTSDRRPTLLTIPDPTWKRLSLNRTNLGPFQITNFSTFSLTEPKCTELWSEHVQDLFHLGQSDQIWAQIWSPLFGKMQVKQQGDLDDASGNHRLLNIY